MSLPPILCPSTSPDEYEYLCTLGPGDHPGDHAAYGTGDVLLAQWSDDGESDR